MELNESTGGKAPARQERTASELTARTRKDVGHRRDDQSDPTLVTDGGRFVDAEAYYLFDDVDERIIAECADRDAALEAARERDPDRFVAIAGDAVLQLMRDGHTIEWATDDQDVREVTDGGTPAESYALSESPNALGGRLEGGR